MDGPGDYVPDVTEGITRVEDLPKPKIKRQVRSHKKASCPNGTAVGFGAFSGVVAQSSHLPGRVFVSRRPEFLACHRIGQSE